MDDSIGETGVLARHAPEIDHIAFAVRNVEESVRWYTRVLGFELVERRSAEGNSGGMLTAVVKAGSVTIVLLQGTNPDSQISRFVESYGPGLHHLALRTSGIDEVVSELGLSGLAFDTPIVGNSELRQAFSHRDVSSNVKLEFIQREVEGFSNANMSELLRSTESKGAL